MTVIRLILEWLGLGWLKVAQPRKKTSLYRVTTWSCVCEKSERNSTIKDGVLRTESTDAACCLGCINHYAHDEREKFYRKF